jgi:hypothetical protein
MLLYYYAIKGMFLFGLVRSYVKFEPLQKHWLFLSILYTLGLAFLSWVFVVNTNPQVTTRAWQIWLLKTFVLVIVYFKLLERFDEGMIFWVIFLVGGFGLIWF